MRRLLLSLAIATPPVILAVFAGLVVHTCFWGGQDSSGNPGSPGAQQTLEAMDEAEILRHLSETSPIKSYSSFDEAEQVAGYHIPRPSPEYPVAFGLTHLRWFPQFERPLSSTHYTYPPVAPTSIDVIVAPSYFFGGDEERFTGREHTTVGGKSGWLKEGDMSFFFSFVCGEIDGYNVWCAPSAPKEVGWEAFEHFVSTLE
jgi:hypothetical protein